MRNRGAAQIAEEDAAVEQRAQQWEQYLLAEQVWDDFLQFSPEAWQWMYNVQ